MFDINTFIGLGGGAIIMALVNKLLSLRKDNQDLKSGAQKIVADQTEYLTTVNAKLNEVITELQSRVCYLPNCGDRISGAGMQGNESNHANERTGNHAKKRQTNHANG